ncbi:cell division protein gtp binding protein [Diplodia corticola]|uniref:Cell division protein gtp binding protein n=1 Tax=Diplodia corticola TaxID=236234 RepID=A0A1J9RP35_9PEZI|nr:cell division protein gtp binding protein [Diplodia corticola]OJD29333.1 cell division protein gtp binding protein [Diplodia corticola]
MRPPAGGDAAAPPHSSSRLARKSSSGADHASNPAPPVATGPTGPTSFFLCSEDEVQQSVHAASKYDSSRESTYGVQSLDDALGAAFGDKGSRDQADKSTSPKPRCRADQAKRWSKEVAQVQKELQDVMSGASRPQAPVRNLSAGTLSSQPPPLPLTPVQFELSSGPASDLPSTPKSVSLKSFRLSDEESQADEAVSQAIVTSDEEDDGLAEKEQVGDTVPQLVMPSIQMPKRRPFTEKGKTMGRLKVLIAGEPGESIVQLCEDIVHVDPLAASPSIFQSSDFQKGKSRRKKQRASGTTSITEVYASTRTYPTWWSDKLDIEDNRTLRRRKSMGDSVLERNLCFIDTPGIDSTSNLRVDPIVQYIESLLQRNASLTAMSDSDLLGMLSGNGGVHVDVVFYMLKPSDDAGLSRSIEHIRRLSSLTNVIPLISHSDTRDEEKISSLKTTVLQRLQAEGVRPFLFGKSMEEAINVARTSFDNTAFPDSNPFFETPKVVFTPGPFAITSASASDNEIMDASLLMSPDYIQPLVPSELAALVNQVFNQDTISWLRHSAAKKFLRWRNERIHGESLTMHGFGLNTGAAPQLISNAAHYTGRSFSYQPSAASSILSSPPPSQVLIPRPGTGSTANTPFSPLASYTHISPASPSSTPGGNNFAITRLNEQNYREERMAQARLAKWAADLQRSLQNERRRFEELEQEKRTRWLLDQVGREVLDGRIIPAEDLQPTQHDPALWSLTRQTDLHERLQRESRWSSAKGGGGVKLDPRDPLGLCDWSDDMKRGGLIVVQVLGGVGVLGAVVVAVWQWRSQGSGGGFLAGWLGASD